MDSQEIILTGLLALALGTVAVAVIVRYDLAPASRLDPAQKWILGCALGSGIVAFAVKLIVIFALSVSAGSKDHVLEASGKTGPEHSAARTWEALPSSAPEPANNKSTPEKIALGLRLFHEPALSRNGRISCASCHDTELQAGVDGKRVSNGISGKEGKRNAPSVFNSAFQQLLFWDGRKHSLEEQALGPLLNPDEMGNRDLESIADHIKGNTSYIHAFESAFGKGAAINALRIAQAIAAYERTLITADTPYDRFVNGDQNALTAQQIRGMHLFKSVGCISCHSGPNFSTASMVAPDKGKAGWRPFPVYPSLYTWKYKLIEDKGAARASSGSGVWRVPSLRNVAATAPYFHNGSVDTLREAVRIMAEVQLGRVVTHKQKSDPVVLWNPEKKRFDSYMPTPIREADLEDLSAFLQSLTSDKFAKGKTARK